jgi:DNA uptake protein ComE-like DNA-binding protein
MSRAFALYAVLVTVTIGALVAASVVYSAQAQRIAADAAARRVQSRAIAWSGVQAAQEELRLQRGDLLLGRRPVLSDEWPLFVDADGRRAVARPVISEGQAAASEAGKIDINAATVEMLALVPGLDPEIAARIVAARGAGKFGSVRDLASIEGLRGAFAPAPADSAPAGADAFVPPTDPASTRPLEELLTVFAFDPNVQAGMGRGAESHSGARRISLRGTWSEALGDAIRDRYDDATANIVKSVMEQGSRFERDADLIRVLRRYNSPPADWAEVLDVFCADPSPFRNGRVDVLAAPREVLACLPGFDAAAAEQAVSLRDKLAPEQRLSVCWLVTENILTPDRFEQAFEFLCARSLQWRIVVEAGFVPADSDEGDERPPLNDRVVLEAVIDVASERPRVAYLRDVTSLGAARRLGPLRATPDPAAAVQPPANPELAPPGASPAPGSAVSSSPRRTRSGTEEPRRSPPPDAGAGPSDEDPRIGRWTTGGRR